jgi:hypothetical protein
MKIYNLQFTIYNFKRKVLSFLFSFLIINFTLLIVNSPVHAQEVFLSITPPLTELTIQPGRMYSQTFTVKNEGTPVVISAKIFPFVPLTSQGHAELIEDTASVNAFADWFYFDPNPISLGPTASRDFIVRITPPANAEEKDYYFTFITEVQNDGNLGITSAQAKARIGANLLINVSKDGNPQRKASIIKFTAPKIIDSFTGFSYKVLVANSGFSFFKPIGKITIDQIFGSTTTLNLAPLNVLVGGSREISCIENEVIIPCKLPGKFLIGIYRSDLSFTINGTGENIQKQIYTFAFPFSILLGVIVIFFIYRITKKIVS